jgi:hypothetical protein
MHTAPVVANCTLMNGASTSIGAGLRPVCSLSPEPSQDRRHTLYTSCKGTGRMASVAQNDSLRATEDYPNTYKWKKGYRTGFVTVQNPVVVRICTATHTHLSANCSHMVTGSGVQPSLCWEFKPSVIAIVAWACLQCSCCTPAEHFIANTLADTAAASFKYSGEG